MSVVPDRRAIIPAADSASPLPERSAGTDFASRFCARHGVKREAFRAAVLRRTLYPLARFFTPLLRLSNSDYFAADFDFIDGVGRISSRREFGTEADEFTHHPGNRGMLRQTLRLRVSIARMRSLVNETFGEATNPPFGKSAKTSSP